LGEHDAAARRVVLRGPEGEATVTARVVFAADGLAGGVLARAGAPPATSPAARIGAGGGPPPAPPPPPPRPPLAGLRAARRRRGAYGGAVRVEDGRLDLASALDGEAVRREGGPAPAAARVLREAHLPVPASLERTAWRGTPPLTRRAARVAHHRLFLLGDATG